MQHSSEGDGVGTDSALVPSPVGVERKGNVGWLKGVRRPYKRR